MRKSKISNQGLRIDVRELASGVLEEELAFNGIDGGKNVYENYAGREENNIAILTKEKVPVGNQKIQIAHEPKHNRQQDGDGDDESVGNHGPYLNASSSRK